MIKLKKIILLTLGTMSIVSMSIAAVVSCSITKSTGTEISALDKALMAVPKPTSLKEYKACIIKKIKENFYKDEDKTTLINSDFQKVIDAIDSKSAMTAANNMSLFHKAKEAVNTVITIDGKDYNLKKFVMKPELEVIKPGNAKVEQVEEVFATPAIIQELIYWKIDKAKDIQALKDIFADYYIDNQNKNSIIDILAPPLPNISAAKEKARNFIKMSFEKKAPLFNNDYVPPVKAQEAVNTVIIIDGVKIPLNKFVVSPTLKVKVPGNKKFEFKKANPSVEPIFENLPAYREALKKVIKDNFTNGDASTKFTDADLKTITHANNADSILAAAKKIKIYVA